MKVFISGSKTIGKLPDKMKAKLKQIANDSCEILVGDCCGVDVAVQKYYADIGYKNITVYSSGEKVRNNIGSNPVIHIPVSKNIKGYEFYKQKDIAMAKECDFAIVLWNGKTKGTKQNIEELKSQGKTVLIYNIYKG